MGRREPVVQPATAREPRSLPRGGRFSRCGGSRGEEDVKKAKWLSLATVAALVVGMLALASLAWAQEADQGDVGAEVVGGTAVPDGKYPFMASLQDDREGTAPRRDHFCGGTQIGR